MRDKLVNKCGPHDNLKVYGLVSPLDDRRAAVCTVAD